MDTSTRTPLVVIGLVLLLVVALTVVVAAVVEPVSYEPGTPEGAVQGFVQAVLDGDEAAALASIDPSRGCGSLRLDEVSTDGVAARIEETSVEGTTASVIVRFDEDEDPFGPGWSHRETFGLERSGGVWYIETTTWFYRLCTR